MFLLLVPCIIGVVGGTAYHELNSVGNRQAIVHLFEWRWGDIAAECERFLGPMGYAGVQVSPPNEHLIVNKPMRPWWERYQPISYKLDSRSGTAQEFKDMVDRCNRAGVRIYVDAVINHMVGSDRGNGTGTAGSYYSAPAEYFPGVPWTKDNFNGHWDCPTYNQGIMNWDDPVQVRNCRLLGLLDLATTLEPVREGLAAYLNALIDIGVAGVRVDAAKHIWPADMMAIVRKTKNLNTKYFPAGSTLMTYQEVIDWGNSPVSSDDYRDSGRICLFVYGKEVSQAINGGGGRHLAQFGDIGTAWGAPWKTSENALVFIDNHDTQRQNGAGVLTFKDPTAYKKAVTFMLALPYGAAKVMSSYEFTNFDAGPPHNPDYSTAPVPINPDGSCGGGWVCEHRWHEIAQMAKFRWVTAGEPSVHWTSDGDNKVGFGRGNKGFYAINKDGGAWTRNFQTNLPAGQYCDVISGDLVNGQCTGLRFDVGGNGVVSVTAGGNGSPIPVVAFHIYSRIGGPTLPPVTNPAPSNSPQPTRTVRPSTQRSSPSSRSTTTTTTTRLAPTPTMSGSTKKTVVFLRKADLTFGEDMFIRGGLDNGHTSGCTNYFSPNDKCSIPIQHITKVQSFDVAYKDWSQGDNFLDWHGAEPGQGEYNGVPADGTPLVWSTSMAHDSNYQPLNHYGDYFMVEVLMDCSRSKSGWFELKGFTPYSGWESNVYQSPCTGSGAGTPPYQSINHFARCGYVNVFEWDSNSCLIDAFPPSAT